MKNNSTVNRNNKKRKRELVTVRKNKVTSDRLFDQLNKNQMPREFMRAAPVALNRTVKLVFNSSVLLQGASPFVLYELRANGAFSPDNIGTPAGFNEWSAMYSLYLVSHVRFRYEFVSNEPAIPVRLGVILRDIQPSTIINTFAKAVNALGVSPTLGFKTVGETSGMGVYRSPWFKFRPADVLAFPVSYNGNANYGSVNTANPTAVIWITFIALSMLAATNLTNGLFLTVFVEFTTKFYSNLVLEI